LKLQGAQICNLALSEESVAHDVAGTLLLDIREQAQRGVHVRKIMLGLLDLGFVGRDPPMDLCPLVPQRLDDQIFVHAPHESRKRAPSPAATVVRLLHNAAGIRP
jgi:hypothetical protein